MIATEIIIIKNGVRMVRTYSDAGYRVKQDQTNIVYDEAIDNENSGYIYTETEESAEVMEPQEALDMAFGGIL